MGEGEGRRLGMIGGGWWRFNRRRLGPSGTGNGNISTPAAEEARGAGLSEWQRGGDASFISFSSPPLMSQRRSVPVARAVLLLFFLIIFVSFPIPPFVY